MPSGSRQAAAVLQASWPSTSVTSPRWPSPRRACGGSGRRAARRRTRVRRPRTWPARGGRRSRWRSAGSVPCGHRRPAGRDSPVSAPATPAMAVTCGDTVGRHGRRADDHRHARRALPRERRAPRRQDAGPHATRASRSPGSPGRRSTRRSATRSAGAGRPTASRSATAPTHASGSTARSPPTGTYAERSKEYDGPGLTVRDDRSICVHAGFCGTTATNVWKMVRHTDATDVRSPGAWR